MTAAGPRVLFAAGHERWADYEAPLRRAFAELGLTVDLARDLAPESVDSIVYDPKAGLDDFRPYTRCKAVLSLWAGVESIVGNRTLTQPLCRMVDPGLTEGMVEWVTGHVLRHHLDIDFSLSHQAGEWVVRIPPLARDRHVGVLGLGALGASCARALAALNFRVSGWARRPKEVPGVTVHSGADGLDEVLSRSEILVTLLPLTPETRDILDARALALMPKGAVVVNPGRGALIDDAALLAALDSGHLGHATLDVFRVEPLPRDHPFWGHPRVTVTPHIAAETRPASAARVIAENVRRGEAGAPFLYLVDRGAGY